MPSRIIAVRTIVARLSVWGLAMASAAALVGAAEAGTIVTVTTSTGNGADARVQGGDDADVNYGDSTWLHTKAAALSDSCKSYLRFDVSSAVWQNPGTAALLLTVESVPTEGMSPAFGHPISVFGLSDGDAGESWNEQTITWNTGPANEITGGNGLTSAAQYLGQLVVPPTAMPGETFVFESPVLLSFVLADSNGLVTLITTDDLGVSSTARFATRESPFAPPALQIVSAPCPDTNGDDTVDVDDLVAIILAWNTSNIAADVDGSGAVDVDDLVAVILGWGSCP